MLPLQVLFSFNGNTIWVTYINTNYKNIVLNQSIPNIFLTIIKRFILVLGKIGVLDGTYLLLHSAVTVFPLLENKGIGFAFLKSTLVILSNVTVPPAQNWAENDKLKIFRIFAIIVYKTSIVSVLVLASVSYINSTL